MQEGVQQQAHPNAHTLTAQPQSACMRSITRMFRSRSLHLVLPRVTVVTAAREADAAGPSSAIRAGAQQAQIIAARKDVCPILPSNRGQPRPAVASVVRSVHVRLIRNLIAPTSHPSFATCLHRHHTVRRLKGWCGSACTSCISRVRLRTYPTGSKVICGMQGGSHIYEHHICCFPTTQTSHAANAQLLNLP